MKRPAGKIDVKQIFTLTYLWNSQGDCSRQNNSPPQNVQVQILCRVIELQHCWPTWMLGMLWRLTWLLSLCFSVYCEKKDSFANLGWLYSLNGEQYSSHVQNFHSSFWPLLLVLLLLTFFYTWPPHCGPLAPTAIKSEKKFQKMFCELKFIPKPGNCIQIDLSRYCLRVSSGLSHWELSS